MYQADQVSYLVFSYTESFVTIVYVIYERAFMNITNLFCKNILITDHDELWIILDWGHILFFQNPNNGSETYMLTHWVMLINCHE